MDAHKDSLLKTLEELIVLYGNLFDLLLKEKNYLIAADLDLLVECNKTKEALLFKIKKVDQDRQKAAQNYAYELGIHQVDVRLSEIAKKLIQLNKKDQADLFANVHQTLSMQIERVQELNQENEVYAQSALKTLNGAISDIKNTVSGKKIYGQSGKITDKNEVQSGNFVSKEV